MKRNQKLIRPGTLEIGATYLLRDFIPPDRKIAWVPVRFVSYVPCPGIVIVANGRGSKMHVQRQDLFCTGGFQD
ncbi:MAG: hypothetical protein ABSE06_16630 [Anaerolineaceae bacterium]|jgi:hypothetical protein